ncbi:MAG: glycosyltransferase WbuB [Pedobacter sp.]|nr:MAG: glycosyltransferase WbuB [Pedobacter sp.]
MNVLFLTMIRINSLAERGIYTDLMQEFVNHGHQVYIARPSERRFGEQTGIKKDGGLTLLNIKTYNFKECSLVEKGFATLRLEGQFLSATKRYFKDTKFDLIIYSTPPITFSRVISYFKKRDSALSYLLLKDIFPQNAVDLNMMKKGGLIHRYFRAKEHQLYAVSDYIGCMSPANVNYVLKHNPSVSQARVEVNPNSNYPLIEEISETERIAIREKYGIPTDKIICVYGGNLGVPQGIGFLKEILQQVPNDNIFYLIVGTGTAFDSLNDWFQLEKPSYAVLFNVLPKDEYDILLRSCDIGLIFLDPRFTIPNFPSRLLSYMECGLPVLAATDCATDIGEIAKENGFGFWCESGDLTSYQQQLKKMLPQGVREEMGAKGLAYLKENYHVSASYQQIARRMKNV